VSFSTVEKCCKQLNFHRLLYIVYIGYVLQLSTSFLINPYLFSLAFNISNSEANLLKSELGIIKDLASLLYLARVS
jgi:hypothetical protein